MREWKAKLLDLEVVQALANDPDKDGYIGGFGHSVVG
jgi:hypothetical protein